MAERRRVSRSRQRRELMETAIIFPVPCGLVGWDGLLARPAEPDRLEARPTHQSMRDKALEEALRLEPGLKQARTVLDRHAAASAPPFRRHRPINPPDPLPELHSASFVVRLATPPPRPYDGFRRCYFVIPDGARRRCLLSNRKRRRGKGGSEP
jgi:hypothetical protein